MQKNHLAAVVLAAALLPAAASADSGFYLGAGIGSATIDVNSDVQLPIFPGFDENDTGYKVFGGYTWQLPVFSLGIEGGYTDFGKPSATIAGQPLSIEGSGLNLWGVAGVGLGPVDVYGKAGVLRWDADANFDGSISTDDGNDPGYGLGLRFNLGPVQLRGEYEVFDVDGFDVSLFSVGAAYRF